MSSLKGLSTLLGWVNGDCSNLCLSFHRYYMLTPSTNWGPDLKNLCNLILAATIKEEDKYQIGLSKIFFRAGMLAYLETVRTDRLNYLVTLMQKKALGHFHQTRYQRLRKSTIGIQSVWRRTLARREADRRRKEEAALEIQRVVRGHLQRKQFLRTRNAVVKMQAIVRARKARTEYLEKRREVAAVRLQSFWRGRCGFMTYCASSLTLV
jgi:myosin-5